MSVQIEQFLQNSCSLGDFSINQLAGDASSRVYYRVTLHDKKSYILCQDSDKDNFERFLSAQTFFLKSNISVPRVLNADKENLLILQEDLGDCSLNSENAGMKACDVYKNYKRAIDVIEKIVRVKQDRTVFLFQWSFDSKKLQEEIQLAHRFFTIEYLNMPVTEKLKSSFDIVIQKILTIPYVLVHRDYHTRNIHIYNKREFLIDFQDARLGPLPYDLVSLLEDPYSPIDEDTRSELLDYFYNYFKDDYKYEDFIYWYEITAIQRLYKILGSFTFLRAEKGKDQYVQYIDYSVERLGHYTSKLLKTHPEFSAITHLIEGIKNVD